MWGGHRTLRYALIGLAPYSFHQDLSKVMSNYLLLNYLIAFNDLHNFPMSPDVYRNFLRKEYLSAKLPLEPRDYIAVPLNKRMDQTARLDARRIMDGWSSKHYPETRDENVRILDEYLSLCEGNGIRPIMFLPPVAEGYSKYFPKQKIDEFHYLIRQAQRKHPSAAFVDGWQLRGVTDADFYNADHLNYIGAAKFSEFLNSVIEQLAAQGR